MLWEKLNSTVYKYEMTHLLLHRLKT